MLALDKLGSIMVEVGKMDSMILNLDTALGKYRIQIYVRYRTILQI